MQFKVSPIRVGNKYFIAFVNDGTKYRYVCLLKSNDEVMEKFVLYKPKIGNQLNVKMTMIKSE